MSRLSQSRTDQDPLDRIEKKLDRLLAIFGEGESVTRTSAELRRMAQAKVLQLEEKRRRKEGYVSADDK